MYSSFDGQAKQNILHYAKETVPSEVTRDMVVNYTYIVVLKMADKRNLGLFLLLYTPNIYYFLFI